MAVVLAHGGTAGVVVEVLFLVVVPLAVVLFLLVRGRGAKQQEPGEDHPAAQQRSEAD